jgi:hypothetical protein
MACVSYRIFFVGEACPVSSRGNVPRQASPEDLQKHSSGTFPQIVAAVAIVRHWVILFLY